MPIEFLGEKPAGRQMIWRYMKLSALMQLLRGEAFFPAVSTLQSTDRLEGALHTHNYWFFAMLQHLKGRDAYSGLEDWLKSQWDPSERDTYEKNGSVPEYQLSLLAEEYIRQLAKRRAVWCWLIAEGESAAMWPIYAPGGVAIGTTVDALSSSLPERRRFCASRIRYVDDQDLSSSSALSPEDPSDEPWLFRPHFVKLLGYAHEHELRVSTRCWPGEAGVIVRKIKWENLIKKIILSPVLHHDEAKAVKNCLKELMGTSQFANRAFVFVGRDSGG